MINQIGELAGVTGQRGALFTVLTELYVNALDHGVLALSSSLKAAPDGFEHYMQERTERLAALNDGWVRIAVTSPAAETDAAVQINISDSGDGFDVEQSLPAAAAVDEVPLPYGRGLALVRALCNDVSFASDGNSVSASYHWRRE